MDVDALHFLVRDSDAFGVSTGVELASYGQAGVGGCRADQVNDDAVADQRLGTPVHGDEREQSMLHLVPSAGAQWKGLDVVAMPISLASVWSSRFHSRKRDPLLPPPSAVIVRCLAAG